MPMTPEELEKLESCVTIGAVITTRLDKVEERIDEQDKLIDTLQYRAWVSEGMISTLGKLWPIIAVAAASIIAGWFLKTFL